MSIPTITSITPSSGVAGGGELVTIGGTNFRQYVPPAYGYIGGDYQATVSVTFGGIAASKVYIIDTTEIIVEIPVFGGAIDTEVLTPVDIVVQNLNDEGNPIAGESKTLTAGFQYIRESIRPPTLTVESPTKRIVKELIRIFKRELLLNSGTYTHTDYSADGVVIAQADVPSFYFIGPDISADDSGEENEEVDVYNEGGSGFLVPPPVMHTFSFDYVCACNAKMELLNLMGAVRKILRRNVKLIIAGDIPEDTLVKMPICSVVDPSIGSPVANANLQSFSGTFEVRRVPILYLPAYYPTQTIDDIDLQVQRVNGTLVEVVELEEA